jgi:hypothetical protein
MKGETVHAVFAEVEQQRAEQDQSEPRLDPAQQEDQRFNGHAHDQRGNACVTKKYEKHLRYPLNQTKWPRAKLRRMLGINIASRR